MGFIEDIAKYVIEFASSYGIKVHSPIIAQAILESASGTSELAINACNYFGMKYRSDVATESYVKIGSEQNADGSYTSSVMLWCKFPNMSYGVKGYFDFINRSRYANLKGITDPKTYLETIKADGYATSLKYVDNLMAVINKYNLTQYDSNNNEEETKTMKINVHAGHNPDGKTGCGAVGLIKESTEARKVKDRVISKLRALGHTVYDCTVEDGTSQNDVLQKIVKKCNTNKVDVDISIHFNAGGGSGTEVFLYSSTSKAKTYAEAVNKEITSLGYKNRGIKYSTSLYVLKKTTSPAILIECCFVDSNEDISRYDAEDMAAAIVKGITGKMVTVVAQPTTTKVDTSNAVGSSADCPFIVECLDNLNIRSTPAGSITKANGCKKGTKYTITKVNGNWGFLKSGAGWISIHKTYVRRV